jgi:hypothetical protein
VLGGFGRFAYAPHFTFVGVRPDGAVRGRLTWSNGFPDRRSDIGNVDWWMGDMGDFTAAVDVLVDRRMLNAALNLSSASNFGDGDIPA